MFYQNSLEESIHSFISLQNFLFEEHMQSNPDEPNSTIPAFFLSATRLIKLVESIIFGESYDDSENNDIMISNTLFFTTESRTHTIECIRKLVKDTTKVIQVFYN